MFEDKLFFKKVLSMQKNSVVDMFKSELSK